jgi:TDG/mug DNA glycosylase family protein
MGPTSSQDPAKGIPDLVGPGLRVLFCGINPGRLSGETGLHFARAGNRFWKLLHGGGFTDRVLLPSEQSTLPAMGIGITNIVERTTTAASELGHEELRAGALVLEAKAVDLRPRVIAILGLGAYRTAFGRPRAVIGEQPETLGGATLWLLPNPSGLQAQYQLPEMTDLFRALHRAAFGAQ